MSAGGLDHLGPLLGFVGDELAEVGGRAGKHRAAKVGEPRIHLGIGEGRVDFLVELVDDLGGRVPGRADAEPGARFVARHEVGDLGTSGSASERVAVVTASARSLPARMYSIDDGMVSKPTCTCPPSKSVSAGASPRYGTWTI